MEYQENGNLIPGVHSMSWLEFEQEFGVSAYRLGILEGLKIGLYELKKCGCNFVYIDGSYVTKKELPGDFDACWDTTGVNIAFLMSNYPTLIDFSNERKNQKLKYKGEFFPANFPADGKTPYIDFFQTDRDGAAKGIVQINLQLL